MSDKKFFRQIRNFYEKPNLFIYLFIYFYLIRYLQSIKEYLEPLAKNLFLAYRRATVKKVN